MALVPVDPAQVCIGELALRTEESVADRCGAHARKQFAQSLLVIGMDRHADAEIARPPRAPAAQRARCPRSACANRREAARQSPICAGTTNAVHVGMPAYPVQLEVSPPLVFERMQLLVRLAITVALAWLGITLGWLWCVLFLVLPIVAAIVVSAKSAEHYTQDTGGKLLPALAWLLELSAYLLLVTDRVPIDERHVHIELRTTGHPSVGSALARLITSIPSAFVLCIVGFASCVLWAIALFSILFRARVPASILEFQTGYLRWQARLAAYHASLVEEYPPFSFGDRTSNLPTAMVQP